MNAPHAPHSLRLAALRAELRRHGLAGLVVPRTDEHQGEYVPPSAQRLSWLTGFQGSAGMAVVFADEAAVFVDGRYTVQVRQQVDGSLFAYKHLIEEPPEGWVKSKLKAGERFALDPWLHSADAAQRFRRACDEAGATLELVTNNPLDVVWEDQPQTPRGAVKPQPLEFAGESSLDKRGKLSAELTNAASLPLC